MEKLPAKENDEFPQDRAKKELASIASWVCAGLQDLWIITYQMMQRDRLSEIFMKEAGAHHIASPLGLKE